MASREEESNSEMTSRSEAIYIDNTSTAESIFFP